MRKIWDYHIISTSKDCGDPQTTLGDFVRAAIRHGWEPLGGPVVINGSLAQAMVAYEKMNDQS